VARSIFFYTDSRTLGGAEEALLMLIDALDRDFWQVTLGLDDVPSVETLAERASALGADVRFVRATPLGLTGLRRMPYLFRRLRAERPDVFHAHLSWPLAAKYPLAAAVAARVPAVLATVHLIPEFVLDYSSFLQLRALSRGVGRYIAVSRQIATELTGRFEWPSNKVEVINNAVRAERFEVDPSPELRASLSDDPSWPIVLTCARLHAQKGHALLLQAARQMPETVFAFAGDGPLKATLEAQASSLGVTDRVRFLGVRTDIPELLASSDAFALPSLYEGSPLAVLEAMAAGRAVVSSAVGGVPELVADGITGLLITPSSIDELVVALRRVLGDVQLRAGLERRARERAVRDFAPEAMAARVVEVYEDLLGRRH
jgi:glycosyltransferase involved in cell wall biosynthesis